MADSSVRWVAAGRAGAWSGGAAHGAAGWPHGGADRHDAWFVARLAPVTLDSSRNGAQLACDRCLQRRRPRNDLARAGRTLAAAHTQPDGARMSLAASLDRVDIQLLAELQRQGRLSNAELAERVHLSPSACLRRVQRLERSGVIAGYRAEVDPERIGLGLTAFVRIRLNHHDAAAVADFARGVNEWDEVVACHALTGDMDYLLQVMVTDLEHFSRFLLDRVLARPGVGDVNSSFVLRTVKAMRGLPLPTA